MKIMEACMTKESQALALAELDGWCWTNAPHDSEVCWRKNGLMANIIPNYLTSFDAIIPLAQKLGVQIAIDKETTPAEVCEIVLRITGKWKV